MLPTKFYKALLRYKNHKLEEEVFRNMLLTTNKIVQVIPKNYTFIVTGSVTNDSTVEINLQENIGEGKVCICFKLWNYCKYPLVRT